MKFIDSNIYLGRDVHGFYKSASSASEMLKIMDGLNIEKAVAWHITQHDYSPAEGNIALAKTISGSNRLLGCWTILPAQTEEVIKKDFFEQMKKNRIVAIRVFPVQQRFILSKAVFGKVFNEMMKRNIPLMLSLRKDAVTWEMIYSLLKEYPELLCILCDIGIWGVDRYTFPLLENHRNVYLETSLLSLNEGSFDLVVKKYGAERLVFGSGFPERYPEAAMLDLIHANISETDKIKIAYKNMENIISRVKL